MKFEDLLKVPLEEMTDEEVDEIARNMDIGQLKTLEKTIRKVGVKKKRATKKIDRAKDKMDALIAKGLSS